MANYIIGIDEVGRGPLAGPICFCFVKVLEKNYKILKKDKNLPKKGFDSKKLKKEQRGKFALHLKKLQKDGFLDYNIITFSNNDIDHFGLSLVIKKSIEKGLKKIKADEKDLILFDGGLKTDILKFPNQKTIIKGDEKEKIISWASVIGKVYRDSIMQKYAKKYPKYGFDKNVGYGTKEHLKAVADLGICSLHRKSFLTKVVL